MVMVLKTRIFGLSNGRYQDMSQLSEAMGISVSQIYRVYHGKRPIGEKFVVGAIKAFPEYKLDDLFYVSPERPRQNTQVAKGYDAAASTRIGVPYSNHRFMARLRLRKHDEAVKLRRAGLNYAEIGRKLGISRQWAWQITQGEPTPQNPDLRSKDILTTSNVAQLLGVHPYTVRRWSREGMLQSYRYNPRGARRFRREDIDSFVSVAQFLGMHPYTVRHWSKKRIPVLTPVL